jgi:uncharacterized membrane protein YukC
MKKFFPNLPAGEWQKVGYVILNPDYIRMNAEGMSQRDSFGSYARIQPYEQSSVFHTFSLKSLLFWILDSRSPFSRGQVSRE